jgi:hypothetical protein
LVLVLIVPWFSSMVGVRWWILLSAGLSGLAVIAWILSGVRLTPGAISGLLVDQAPPDGEVPLIHVRGLSGRANEVIPEIAAFDGVQERLAALGGATRGPRARKLLGRVALFSVFVGRDGQSWNDGEVAEAFRAMERAGRWIEAEASDWGVPVNIERVRIYFRADDPQQNEELVELTLSNDPYETILDEDQADLKGLASASRAAVALGFHDLADLVGEVDGRVDHDATVWMVFLMRSGRSSAIGSTDFLSPGVELILCYGREATASEPLVGLPFVDPVTLAHELMHNFGATDKYGTSLKEFPTGSVTERDIMRLDTERLGKLRVDPLTAMEIGWSETLSVRPQTKNARQQREVDAGRDGF